MTFWSSLEGIDLGSYPIGQIDDIDRVFIGYLKVFFRDNPLLLDPQEPSGAPTAVNVPVLYLMESPRSWKHGGDDHQTQFPMVTVQMLEPLDSTFYPSPVGQYEEVRGASVFMQDFPRWKTFPYQVSVVANDPLTARRLSSALKELVFPYRFGCRVVEIGGANRPLSISAGVSQVDRDEGTFRTDYTFQIDLPLVFDVGQDYDRIQEVVFYSTVDPTSLLVKSDSELLEHNESTETDTLDFS